MSYILYNMYKYIIYVIWYIIYPIWPSGFIIQTCRYPQSKWWRNEIACEVQSRRKKTSQEYKSWFVEWVDRQLKSWYSSLWEGEQSFFGLPDTLDVHLLGGGILVNLYLRKLFRLISPGHFYWFIYRRSEILGILDRKENRDMLSF